MSEVDPQAGPAVPDGLDDGLDGTLTPTDVAALPLPDAVSTAPEPQRRSVNMAQLYPAAPPTAASTDDWLLTYADMVTLLLTMFVVLVITASYNKAPDQPVGGGLPGILQSIIQLRIDSPYDISVEQDMDDGKHVAVIPAGTSLTVIKDEDLELIERREDVLAEVRQLLVNMKLDQFINANDEHGGVRLEIPNSILFEVGSAEMQDRGRGVLRALVPLLAKGDFVVSVEGHTDNRPIATPQFPSNWELSAFRATQVVRLFIEAGMPATRLEAVGFADTRPLTDNATEAGQAENRRVTILLRI